MSLFDTPPDLIERHVTALLDRLRTDPELDVFEGDVISTSRQTPPERYVNVWHDTGFFTSRTMLGEHQDVDITFTLHAVGDNAWAATWVDGRVLALLNDHILTVPGRRCWPLTPAGTQPVTKDTTTNVTKFLAVRRYVLRSIGAA